MNERDLLLALWGAGKSAEIDLLLESIFEQYGDRIKLMPVGGEGRENNRGQIEIGTDPGKGIVERITNGIDAVLELEHDRHNGIPECRSPREAAISWLNVSSKGLHELSPARRRELASSVIVTITEGDDKTHRTIQVVDSGTGLTPEEMPSTILSLGESNKVQKLYLAGAFGQGGSSTFACCKYSLICSRSYSNPAKVGFTIVYYQDLPPDKYKHGMYVYLTLDNKLFEAEISLDEFPKGTSVKHFGYDVTEYKYSFGPQSVYGLLQRALFDPIIPILLEDKVSKFNRVIKGSRNALNGAVDDPAERGPSIQHNVPLYHVSLGDFGSIGLEYWLLEESEKEKYEPSKAYVDNRKPILLTVNGQTHAEFSGILIKSKNHGDLGYLRNRLIIHVDCNNLTPLAKRNLFSSSREDVRKGHISNLIEEEIIKALKSDDQLKIFNDEAKSLTLRKTDLESEETIKTEVAKVLRFHGFSATIAVGGGKDESAKGKPSRIPPIPKQPSHKVTKKIDIHDPPTYVKILSESPVDFYPAQRRYIRIETDAPSSYHNAEDETRSRFNIIITGGSLVKVGTTPLKEGRMRIILDCDAKAEVGSTGEVTVELSRPGMPASTDKMSYAIVQKPPPAADRKHISVPKITFVKVEGPEDEVWARLSWPNDISKVASWSELGEELVVYYSTVFPAFVEAFNHFQKTNPSLASSFVSRYKTWLAVHCLLLEHSKKESTNLEEFDAWEHEERCRLATMASIIADKEIRMEAQMPLKEVD